MNMFRRFKSLCKNILTMKQQLAEIREGIANHSDLTNRKMNECINLGQEIVALQQALLKASMKEKGCQDLQISPLTSIDCPLSSFKDVIENIPLMLAEKTYNTSHPKYDANLVRNYPGRIIGENSSENTVYKALSRLMQKQKTFLAIDDRSWSPILDEVLNEIKTIPHSAQVFERKCFIENYFADLAKRYEAHYIAGWVNLEDALFLYWLVRKLKPKTIVQTGVCNGLSSAFMILGLVKNGGEGMLYAIDLPCIFDSKDPAWTIKNKIYGYVIPDGKSSGWMVPDAYRDRFELQCGDAKQLLPQLVDRLSNIDMFYHDSDHTYNHMMFEFKEAKRKLASGGLIIGDDISWNESLWDFADQYHVPAYNYKGAVGTAFF